jgi:hypothetical protein
MMYSNGPSEVSTPSLVTPIDITDIDIFSDTGVEKLKERFKYHTGQYVVLTPHPDWFVPSGGFLPFPLRFHEFMCLMSDNKVLKDGTKIRAHGYISNGEYTCRSVRFSGLIMRKERRSSTFAKFTIDRLHSNYSSPEDGLVCYIHSNESLDNRSVERLYLVVEDVDTGKRDWRLFGRIKMHNFPVPEGEYPVSSQAAGTYLDKLIRELVPQELRFISPVAGMSHSTNNRIEPVFRKIIEYFRSRMTEFNRLPVYNSFLRLRDQLSQLDWSKTEKESQGLKILSDFHDELMEITLRDYSRGMVAAD